MEDVKIIIGKNIQYLRKDAKMTQQALAEKLNYTAKAVSKWERGESIPEIETLMAICSIFNVTLDFLTVADSRNHRKEYLPDSVKNKNNFFMTALVITIVWTIAAIVFVYVSQNKEYLLWQIFAWAVPVSLAIISFAIRYKKRMSRFLVHSLLLWSLLICIFVQFSFQIPLIFLVGIPAQLALLVWSKIIKIK